MTAVGPRMLLSVFREFLREHGAAAACDPEMQLAEGDGYTLYYTPFESVNTSARLVIVGITPGPTQLELSYTEAQRLLAAGTTDQAILQATKKHVSFGGASMRPNLLRMLRHFRFAELLGVSDPDELWGSAAELLHATSVVPHAAFKHGKMFAGSFEEIQTSVVLRESFERDFVASLPMLPRNALFVALGPTPLEALEHCVARGLLHHEQVLGAFAHPSAGGGSQVDVYIGEKLPEDLAARDPVRHRLGFLLPAAERMRAAVDARLSGKTSLSPTATLPLRSPPRRIRTKETPSNRDAAVPMTTSCLHYVVTRGAKAGTVLRPHIHADGCLVVSPTRFESDYVRLPADADVEPYLARGHSLRMSAPGCAPSLIAPASIRGRNRE